MGTATTGTTPHNFAVHNLYVGDDTPWDPTFTPSSTAWKQIGFNLDNLDTTTAAATNTCTPYTKNMGVVDGNGGIDNAFGAIIIGMGLSELGMDLTKVVSQDIAKGTFTLMFDITGLTSPTQTNTGLTGQLFAGAAYGSTPPLTGTSFAETDNWPVNSALLTDGMTIAGGSKVSFNTGYVTNGTWVSGACIGAMQSGSCNLDLSLDLEGYALALTIHDATASFNYTVDASGQGHAEHGVIAGVLLATEFETAINEVVGQINGGAECTLVGTVIGPLIHEAQDMIIDPTTGAASNTPGTPCNGISIGIGFDGDEIALPSVVAPKADAGTALPACGSSGTGSSSGSSHSSSGSSSGSSSSGSGSSGSSSSSSSAAG
jgi:uncharacterized membrane protein YgcG